jgi:tetratricopeptide (TPR) repeat protein
MEAAGHAEMGMNQHILRDYDSARAAYGRALDINPNDPDILADFGHFLISDGAPEQAVEPLRMAIRLRPEHSGMYRYYLACAFYVLHDDETVMCLLSPVEDNQEGHRVMAASYARMGLPEQAARHADLAMKAHPDFTLNHWRTVLPHRDPHIRERLIEDMARGGLP